MTQQWHVPNNSLFTVSSWHISDPRSHGTRSQPCPLGPTQPRGTKSQPCPSGKPTRSHTLERKCLTSHVEKTCLLSSKQPAWAHEECIDLISITYTHEWNVYYSFLLIHFRFLTYHQYSCLLMKHFIALIITMHCITTCILLLVMLLCTSRITKYWIWPWCTYKHLPHSFLCGKFCLGYPGSVSGQHF